MCKSMKIVQRNTQKDPCTASWTLRLFWALPFLPLYHQSLGRLRQRYHADVSVYARLI